MIDDKYHHRCVLHNVPCRWLCCALAYATLTVATIRWLLYETVAFCGNGVKLRDRKGPVGDWCPTFRDSVVTPYSKVECRRTGNSILQDDTKQSRNVWRQSPSAAGQNPKRLDTPILHFFHLLPLWLYDGAVTALCSVLIEEIIVQRCDTEFKRYDLFPRSEVPSPSDSLSNFRRTGRDCTRSPGDQFITSSVVISISLRLPSLVTPTRSVSLQLRSFSIQYVFSHVPL